MDSNKSFVEKGFSSAVLHILAMFFMLCDHSYYTVFSDYEFLTCIGRLAFPIFAFMVVEGFYHTRDVKKYLKRLLIFGLISEIPFNLMLTAQPFYPFHQNVMFTFFLGLSMLRLLEREKLEFSKQNWVFPLLRSGAIVLLFSCLALVTFVDYDMKGILMILTFFIFRQNTWGARLGQLICMYYINCELIGGLVYPVTIGNMMIEFPQQGFALLSLPIIWMYNGKKGYNKTWFRYFCYGFYPAHALILFLLAFFLLQ